MFKNVRIFSAEFPEDLSPETLESALPVFDKGESERPQEVYMGFAPPRGEAHGPIAESIDGEILLKLVVVTRTVPGPLIREKYKDQADVIYANSGRRPGKRERMEMMEEIKRTLIADAFPKTAAAYVWLDRKNKRILVDSVVAARLDAVTAALVNAVPSMVIDNLRTTITPATLLTNWFITTGDSSFTPTNEGMLKSTDQPPTVIRFNQYQMAPEDISRHIAEGRRPTRLRVTHSNSGLALTVTDSLELLKLDYDVDTEECAEEVDAFDASFVLAKSAINLVVEDLLFTLNAPVTEGAES